MQTGLLILTATLVAGIGWLASNIPAVRSAVTLATTKKPEDFTELYFEDHTNLPETIEKDRTYSFSFTVHNLEHQEIEYPYVVYLEAGSNKIVLDSGAFSLQNDEYKSRSESFRPADSLRAEIVVELINENQQIDFWMEGS